MNVIVSEDQYLEDLASLFRRYKLHPGSSGALETLAEQLQANPALRGDLFNLCTAISHMGETDLSPEEMLLLASRAMTGSRSLRRPGEPAIPPALRAVFVDEYTRWANRDQPQEREIAPGAGDVIAASTPQPTKVPSSGTPFASAAERRRSDRRKHNPEIKPDTPIGDLTISQLRGYLDEIESRVDRLQPYLESLRDGTPPTASSTVRAATSSEPPVPREARPPDFPSAAPDPMHFHRGRALRRGLTSEPPPSEFIQPEEQLRSGVHRAAVEDPATQPLRTAAPRNSQSPVPQPADAPDAREVQSQPAQPPVTRPVADAASPDPEKADGADPDEPEPVVLLPHRGTAARSYSHTLFAAQPVSSPEPVLFRALEEPPPRHTLRYVLAIVASLVLIGTSGAAGYRYYFLRNPTPAPVVAPSALTAPGPASPAPADATPLPPSSQNQHPPAPAPAAEPSHTTPHTATPSGAVTRPLHPNSRAIQVEAEAARSEAAQQNSTPPPADQPSPVTPTPKSYSPEQPAANNGTGQ